MTSCHSSPLWSTPPSLQALIHLLNTATVKPLMKKPTLDSADIWSYRTVSLLSFLSKTLEVYNQLSYTKRPPWSKLVRLQDRSVHWNGPSHSDWGARSLQNLDRVVSPRSPRLIFCVWQSTTKSSSPIWLNIADSALTWFTSYLTNLTFQVTWNGSLSKPCFLETGVPQGSVSGPVLFPQYTRSVVPNLFPWSPPGLCPRQARPPQPNLHAL